jgi:predicted porin
MDNEKDDVSAANKHKFKQNSLDIAAKYAQNGITVKAEYLQTTRKDDEVFTGATADKDLKQTAMHFFAGYNFMKNMQAAALYSSFKYDDDGSVDATLSNIHLGLNIFNGDNEKLHIGYIIAGSDKFGEKNYNAAALLGHGLYNDNTFLAAYTMRF